jgi:hypothetical protein
MWQAVYSYLMFQSGFAELFKRVSFRAFGHSHSPS